MPLDPSTEQRIRAEAARRGVDPARALARAEELKRSEPAQAEQPEKLVDKLLIGHLPFVRVRELRTLLGLTERVPDDELMCGEFAAKHGGDAAPAAAASTEPPPV